jgi:hypothetical protein
LQALAWEANARVAIAELDLEGARGCIAKALSTIEGFEGPARRLASPRDRRDLYRASENSEAAEYHRELSCPTILKLADSLAAEEPLRKTFLSAPSVRKVLGNSETTSGGRSRSPTKRVRKSTRR